MTRDTSGAAGPLNICFQCKRGTCTVHATPTDAPPSPPDLNPTEDANDEDEDLNEDRRNYDRQKAQRSNKRDDALKDQQSTGRKRAARLYPLDREASCEWRFKANQGGGTNPIAGCFDGMQLARHHGPDKNTLNNEPGNVHRICHGCHNRWHAKNDPNYDPNKPLKD